MDSVRRRRQAARMILIDEIGRTLLFRGVDPLNATGPTWWFTPGGGREGAETDEETARREVFEETGLLIEVMSGPVLHREFDVVFAGEPIHQVEVYFVAFVPAFEPRSVGWTELERHTILDHRWWSAADLEASTELIYPTNLAELLCRHVGADQR
ncbi:NUDIX hydrolase [Williamsia sp.]|uniref:NUDIX hydrolase n=1 Tax=Williamsia sp. TaxID=1872085 RepID=UPI002F92B382